jgi:hypothetical protein
MKTYASLALLKSKLGITTSNQDDELALALVAATRWVDQRMGAGATADDEWTGSSGDLAVETTPAAHLVKATLAAAVRMYKSTDVPFGIAGMSDQGMTAYVRMSIPEAELILAPHMEAWGVA